MAHVFADCNRLIFTLALLLAVVPSTAAVAQTLEEDMVGQNEEAWVVWSAATRAIERDQLGEAAQRIEIVATMGLKDLRLALMADRTGTLKLEQWAEREDAPAAAKELVAKIANGRRQKGLAEDGWHFAAIGRFQYADANFKALDESNPDTVALLELARRNPNRHDILLKLINNAEVGPSVQRFLELLDLGEQALRRDAFEIVANIDKLGGPPRMVYNATNRLKASGEYAIPHLIQAMLDSSRSHLHPVIIQVIPKIGREALNPLCMALGMEDDVVGIVLINAVSQIGYKQVIPYLVKIAQDSSRAVEVRSAADRALGTLGASSDLDAAHAFLQLAELYYKDAESLRADPRNATANVWYLRDGEVVYVPIPTPIFNDVMAMRASEEALLANPNLEQATAQWLAANLRREAKLGLDVQDADPTPLADKDGTRPENYPRAIYFARAAGAKYNHMVLSIAFRDRDPGVALGAIAALRDTAGEPSLIGAEDLKQPLVQSLNFPNRQVRTEAALALAGALPKTPFAGSDKVIPVLAEALLQSERQAALIVDPDKDLRNKFLALLRATGFDCAVGANLYEALQRGKEGNLTSFDVILMASDVQQPDLPAAIDELRKKYETAATPIIIVAKEDQLGLSGRVARGLVGVEVLLSDVVELGDPDRINEQVASRIARASQVLGMSPLDRDLALQLALRSADVLRRVAESNLEVVDFGRAVPALIAALQSGSEALRSKCVRALALAADASAQVAIATLALDAGYGPEERIAAFGAVAESARHNGNLVGDHEVVSRLIDFTMKEQDLVLRAAASKALGALNLPGGKASEIIRAQHRG